MDTISGLDQLIMLAALRHHPNAYGVSIKDELLVRAGRDYSIGTIYSGLQRLERKGFLKSRMGEPEAKRGGRGKIFFSLTGEGRKTLQESLRSVEQLKVGLILEPGASRA